MCFSSIIYGRQEAQRWDTTVLAYAHFSHATPRNSGLDLPVACFPRAREPGFTPSNRRAPQVCRKAPKIDRGRPPAVDLSVAVPRQNLEAHLKSTRCKRGCVTYYMCPAGAVMGQDEVFGRSRWDKRGSGGTSNEVGETIQ